MLAVMLGASLLVGWVGLCVSALAQTGATPAVAESDPGKQLYMDRCQHCHGASGDGKGVSTAVVYPKPQGFYIGNL